MLQAGRRLGKQVHTGGIALQQEPLGPQLLRSESLGSIRSREPGEVRSRIGITGEVAAIHGVATAVLHAQQLVNAFVELVVADTRHVQPHRVERLD